MNISKFSQQLVRDMKASAAKTAVLGLLLLVGLYFWVPPLLSAFGNGASDVPATATSKPAVANGSTAIPGSTNSAAKPTTSAPKVHDSAAITKLLREHPLFQPAKLDEMPETPFGLNDDLMPLPVEFAADSLAEPPPPPAKTKSKPIERLEGLTLKSTLIGPTRRVAMINSRLFHEGQSVPWKDKQLRLESVTRKAVTLTDGSQSWQLLIKDSRGESKE
ncbi:MAG: hypothetical protein ACKV2Q_08345 [Planctomycetaceae bacterium]